jgi:hypothetical protein
VTFVSNGYIAKTAKILSDNALKAMYILLSLLTRIHVDIIMKLKLFDSLALPILLHSLELWGIYCPKEVDKIKINFAKPY